VAGHAGRALVGHEFTATADGHLDDARRHGGEEHQCQHHDEIGAIVIVSTAKKHPEIGQHTDRTGDGGGDGADEHIVVFDVAELMGDDCFDLLVAEEIEQTLGDSDGGMVVIPPGCKSVGLIIGEDIQSRHRQMRLVCQIFDDPIQPRCTVLIDRMGVVVLEDMLVAVKIGVKVHPCCHHKGDDHPGFARQRSSDEDEEEGQSGEEKIGFESFHYGSFFWNYFTQKV